MIAGMTLANLHAEVEKQKHAAKDYVADTRGLMMATDGRLGVRLGNELREYRPTPLCLGQIAERVGIPSKYAERMRAEAPDLLAANVNHWFKAKPEKRLVRCLHNGEQVARAFLSDRFRRLDNWDLLAAVVPKLERAGCRIESAQVTEKRLYLQAVSPRLEAVIQARKAEGTRHAVGECRDIVQAGLIVSNSEVGCGALRVEPMIYRLVCRNGLILPTALRRHHVGRGMDSGEGEEATEAFTDQTKALDDAAFFAKVCDTVDHALSHAAFTRAVAGMEESAGDRIEKPIEVVELAQERFGLSDDEKERVLANLMDPTAGGLNRYGLANAVTRSAEDAGDYDRAVELERVGGELIAATLADLKLQRN